VSTNAVADVLAFVAVFREFGIPVDFEPGWDSRGNGQNADYQGGILHHTATPGVSYANPSPSTRILRDGRADLSGPLCQFQGCYQGRVRVIAAHPANHAGASGGRSMGPLPVTGAFNRLVVGLEMDYNGVSPMSPEEWTIALVYLIAIKRVYGSVERGRGHWETSIEGKIDPAWAANPAISYDMDAMRAAALAFEETGGSVPPARETEDDVALIEKTIPVHVEGADEWTKIALPSVGGSRSVPKDTGQAWVFFHGANSDAVVELWASSGGKWDAPQGNGDLLETLTVKADAYYPRQLPAGTHGISFRHLEGQRSVSVTVELTRS